VNERGNATPKRRIVRERLIDLLQTNAYEKQTKALYLLPRLHGGHISVSLPLIVAVLKDLFHDSTSRCLQLPTGLASGTPISSFASRRVARRRPATATGRIDTAAP